jgi:hypothetical protein
MKRIWDNWDGDAADAYRRPRHHRRAPPGGAYPDSERRARVS